MEAPPPYVPPAPKKSKTGLIVGLILGGVVLCCILPIGLLVGGGFYAVNKTKDFVTCGTTYAVAQQALGDYVKANNGKLPTADKWSDQLRPFFSARAKKIPEQMRIIADVSASSDFGCKSEGGPATGMAFNKELSGKNTKDIKDKGVIALFEVPRSGKNLSEVYKPQPEASSPKTMGRPRGWITAPLEGSVKAGSGTFNVNNEGIVEVESSTRSK